MTPTGTMMSSTDSSHPPTTQFTRDSSERSIAYAVHGEGPLLICPSWWVSHLEMDWDDPHFRKFFSSLGESFTVVRYDAPGIGLSEQGSLVASLDEALDVLQAVIDAVGQETFSVFGFSAAGPVAVAYAARWPQRIESLAFYGSCLRGADMADAEMREKILDLVRTDWHIGAKMMTDIFISDTEPEAANRFLRRQREYLTPPTTHRLLELLFELDASEFAPRVQAPTVVVHRRQDRAVPFEAGRRLAAAVPHAELVTLEGQLHPPWEDGEDLLEILGRLPLPGEPFDET